LYLIIFTPNLLNISDCAQNVPVRDRLREQCQGGNLRAANLTRADFRGTRLRSTDMIRAKLKGTKLDDVVKS